MATFRDLLARTKAEITEVDTAEARAPHRRRASSCSTSASPTSTSRARSPAPIHIPRGHLEAQVEGRLPDKTDAGRRLLRRWCPLGVRRRDPAASSATPTSCRWPAASAAGRTRAAPGSKPVVLTPSRRNRYQRHLLLPEVGVEGQAKLLESKVLLLGAGGLGSPAALYLAAAGVGTIGIVDMDEVDASQPAAPDPPQPRPDRRPQGRLGEEDAHPAEPRRQRGHLRHPPRRAATSSTSSPATTSSSTAPTTSRPATCSTTPA